MTTDEPAVEGLNSAGGTGQEAAAILESRYEYIYNRCGEVVVEAVREVIAALRQAQQQAEIREVEHRHAVADAEQAAFYAADVMAQAAQAEVERLPDILDDSIVIIPPKRSYTMVGRVVVAERPRLRAQFLDETIQMNLIE